VASIFCFILCDQRLFYAQSHSGNCHVVYEHATAPFFCMCTCSGSPHNVIHSSSYNPQGLFSVQCFQLIHAFCLGTRVPRHRDSVVRLYICTYVFSILCSIFLHVRLEVVVAHAAAKRKQGTVNTLSGL